MTEYDARENGEKSYDLAISTMRENLLRKRVAGIDPGLGGACAVLAGDDTLIDVIDTPVAGKGAKCRVIGSTLARFLIETHATHVVIEGASSRPGQGTSSSFKFGMAFGAVIGVAEALFLPVQIISAAKWKRSLRLDSDKESSRLMALSMWPDREELFARKKDHGRSEAALIAHWALHKGGE